MSPLIGEPTAGAAGTTRLVSLGPITLPTLKGDITETVGDQLETVGAGVVAGERRPRAFTAKIPIRGDRLDSDRRDAGLRLRRQVRALLENPKARLQGLYLNWAVDPEQNGWLLIGGGDIKHAGGGIVFADFDLELSDCYRVANLRTHRPARRLVRLDRRLATTPRDILATLYSTDFAAVTAIARHYLGVAVSDPVSGATRAPASTVTRATTHGALAYLDAGQDGDVVDFEQAEGDLHKAIVVAYDTHGTIPATFIDPTNLVRNPSFEVDGSLMSTQTAATGGGTNIYQRETGWAKVGNASLRARVQRNDASATTCIVARTASGTAGCPVTPGGVVSGAFEINVLLNESYTNVRPAIYWYTAAGAASTTVSTTGTAFTATTGTLARATIQNVTVPADAAFCALALLATSPGGSPGIRSFDCYVDAMIVNTGATVATYFDGDTAGYDWTGTAHASTSAKLASIEAAWEPVFGPDQPLIAGPVLDNALCRVVPDAATGNLDVQTYSSGKRWITESTITHPAGATGFRARLVEWTPDRAVVCISSTLSAGVRGELYVTLQRGWTGPRAELYAINAAGTATASVNVHAKTVGDATYQRSTGTATAIVAGTTIGTFAGLEPWVALLGPSTDQGIALAVLQQAVSLRGATLAGREGLAFESPTGYVSVTMAIGPRASNVADADELGGVNLIDCRQVPEVVARG